MSFLSCPLCITFSYVCVLQPLAVAMFLSLYSFLFPQSVVYFMSVCSKSYSQISAVMPTSHHVSCFFFESLVLPCSVCLVVFLLWFICVSCVSPVVSTSLIILVCIQVLCLPWFSVRLSVYLASCPWILMSLRVSGLDMLMLCSCYSFIMFRFMFMS